MDRLIYKEADGDLTCRSRDFEKVFPTLYEYEESGLTPEQVKTLGANLEAMTELARDLSEKLEQVKKERDLGKTESEHNDNSDKWNTIVGIIMACQLTYPLKKILIEFVRNAEDTLNERQEA